MRFNVILFFFGVCLLLTSACKHDPFTRLSNLPADSTVTTSCDTTNVTYTASIVPILQTYCTTCHGATSYASSGGGFKLATYSYFSGFAKSGLMMNSINQVAGISAMPKGENKLSACNI